MLHHYELLFISKIIQIKFINWQHNNLLAGYFEINKTKKLISRQYYFPSLKKNVKAYANSCNISLLFEAIRYKPYANQQVLPVLFN